MNLIQASALVAPPGPGRAAPPPRVVGTAWALPLPGIRTRRSRMPATASPVASPPA